MKIALLSYGTLGDVLPLAALGKALLNSGHTVQLAAPARLEEVATLHGLGFTGLPGDPAGFVRGLVDDTGGNPLRVAAYTLQFALPLAEQVLAGLRQACQGADLILHTMLLTTGGHTVACELGVPDISVQFFPIFARTGAYPNPGLPPASPGWPPGLRAVYNCFSHDLWDFFFWNLGHGGYPLMRLGRPGLPRRVYWPFRRGKRIPLVLAVSPAVLPTPSDWPERVYQTGYWFLDNQGDWQPPDVLQQFLAAGEAPVCLTFSSVVSKDTTRLNSILVQALSRFQGRAVLLTGWGGWHGEALPGNVLALEAAPHDWLFSRVQAVAHHGGAGTTAAALRAGLPALVVPFSADQPFWAWRVAELGAGPSPLPFSRLTSDLLLDGLNAVLNEPRYRQRAQEIGQKIRQEEGTGEMVRLIETEFRKNLE